MNKPVVKQSNDEGTTTTARLPGWATGIGAVSGLWALEYCLLLQGALRTVWNGLLGIRQLLLPVEPTWHPGMIAVATTGGLIVGYEHILFHFHDQPSMELITMVWGMCFGVPGAGIAIAFSAFFERWDDPWSDGRSHRFDWR